MKTLTVKNIIIIMIKTRPPLSRGSRELILLLRSRRIQFCRSSRKSGWSSQHNKNLILLIVRNCYISRRWRDYKIIRFLCFNVFNTCVVLTTWQEPFLPEMHFPCTQQFVFHELKNKLPMHLLLCVPITGKSTSRILTQSSPNPTYI